MTTASEPLLRDGRRRAQAFSQAAAQRSLNEVIIEKDFWVCWALRALFSSDALAPHLVFKGGTCLSKVYGAIGRFSEDVDLSVSPSFVGVDLDALEAKGSRGARDKALKELQQRCGNAVRETVQPVLEALACEQLGTPAGAAWFEYEFDSRADAPVLHFRYPTHGSRRLAYITPEVKLEFGSLTEQQPTGLHSVAPLVFEVLPALSDGWGCQVVALDLGRCFWEKATILHGEYHRASDEPIPARYARHYADVASVGQHANAGAFVTDRALCERVVQWKDRWFPAAWRRYDLARQGSFRLAPTASRRAELARDYAAMREMFMSEPPSFDELVESLIAIESEINAA